MDDQKVILEFLQQRLLKQEKHIENHLSWIQELKKEFESFQKKPFIQQSEMDSLKKELISREEKISTLIANHENKIDDCVSVATINHDVVYACTAKIKDLKDITDVLLSEKNVFVAQMNELKKAISGQNLNFSILLNEIHSLKKSLQELREDHVNHKEKLKSVENLYASVCQKIDNDTLSIRNAVSSHSQRIVENSDELKKLDQTFLMRLKESNNQNSHLMDMKIDDFKKTMQTQKDYESEIENIKKSIEAIPKIDQNKIESKMKSIEKSIADLYEQLKRINL